MRWGLNGFVYPLNEFGGTLHDSVTNTQMTDSMCGDRVVNVSFEDACLMEIYRPLFEPVEPASRSANRTYKQKGNVYM